MDEREDADVMLCENDECSYCQKFYTGELVCGLPYPTILVRLSQDTRPDVLRCVGYKIKVGTKIEEYQPGRLADGLYKGQAKLKEE